MRSGRAVSFVPFSLGCNKHVHHIIGWQSNMHTVNGDAHCTQMNAQISCTQKRPGHAHEILLSITHIGFRDTYFCCVQSIVDMITTMQTAFTPACRLVRPTVILQFLLQINMHGKQGRGVKICTELCLGYVMVRKVCAYYHMDQTAGLLGPTTHSDNHLTQMGVSAG